MIREVSSVMMIMIIHDYYHAGILATIFSSRINKNSRLESSRKFFSFIIVDQVAS